MTTPMYPASETSKFVPLPRIKLGSPCSLANSNACTMSFTDSALTKYRAGPPTLKEVCSLMGIFSRIVMTKIYIFFVR